MTPRATRMAPRPRRRETAGCALTTGSAFESPRDVDGHDRLGTDAPSTQQRPRIGARKLSGKGACELGRVLEGRRSLDRNLLSGLKPDEDGEARRRRNHARLRLKGNRGRLRCRGDGGERDGNGGRLMRGEGDDGLHALVERLARRERRKRDGQAEVRGDDRGCGYF